ncbi:MAG TPA: hypothetical protein VGE08_15135 [Steroidobacter sp.]|uniref:hypothetical protein n=1 Tax=Steroidobacter sp. TaxID=1978227 RepID=UPI002ED9CB60
MLRTTHRLGPAVCGTVVARDVGAVVDAYKDGLGLVVVHDRVMPSTIAAAWGQPMLAGRRLVLLGADVHDPSTHWLRVLHDPDATAPRPMQRAGWLALEILVRDVRALAARLRNSAFKVLGEPRALEVNDNIWAMQVAGPAGETLYLTEVRGPAPPFQLPEPARLDAQRLFIPVLSAADREDALRFYEELNGVAGLRFETRVSALNSMLGVDPERKRAVGTLQLDGASLIEVDEVPEHEPLRADDARLPSGLAMVSLLARADTPLPLGVTWRSHGERDWPGRNVALLRGAAGEWIELLAQ